MLAPSGSFRIQRLWRSGRIQYLGLLDANNFQRWILPESEFVE
jgi:hypothetical protein